MNILFNNVIPLPLAEIHDNKSNIWQKEQFEFKPISKYLIEAPSGKGKTSLLSIIYGLRTDYLGNIFFDDQDISSLSLEEWTEIRMKKISMVFQGLRLFSELTAMENIMLKNDLTNHKKEEEIIEMAKKLEVENFLNRHCGILSFGQQQRITIIRALCQPFNFLLLDEPFSHLDDKNIDKAYQLVTEECKNQNASLILTSLNSKHKEYFENILNV